MSSNKFGYGAIHYVIKLNEKTIGARYDDLKDQFHDLLTKLEKNQVEYDLGCESIIKSYGSAATGSLYKGV